jgi:DNA mismatch repair protein MSH3
MYLIIITAESFGIECGRLAGLPESILAVAAKRSSALQQDVQQRTRLKKYVFCGPTSVHYLLGIQGLPKCGID